MQRNLSGLTHLASAFHHLSQFALIYVPVFHSKIYPETSEHPFTNCKHNKHILSNKFPAQNLCLCAFHLAPFISAN